ncbi:MAG: alpha/beta fold hydrolase [Lachnospiraceae bacterium]|nr:alpha/beta fold hydrolase [Lachnospiraceae bacterium]
MLTYELIDNKKEDWVVFVHGIGGSTRTWGKQIDAFSEHYNLLLLDLPGHGLNADNIIKKVDSEKLHTGIKDTMDFLNIECAHFVGLSLGTIVIANFAVHHPEYVKSIILGGASLKVSGLYKGAVILADKIKHFVPYKFLYKFFAWFLMPRKNHKKSRKIFLREVVKLNKKTMFAWIEYLQFTLSPENILAKLDEVKKNILIISGDEDHCFLKDAKALVDKMKSVEINIIEKCGHVCSIEKSSIFNHMALDFLKV